MIKAILWDNDGVLVDTEQLYYEATRDVMASTGIALSEEQYKDLFLLQGRGAWHLAAEKGISPEEIERLREERNDVYSRGLTRSSLAMAGVETLGAAARDDDGRRHARSVQSPACASPSAPTTPASR